MRGGGGYVKERDRRERGTWGGGGREGVHETE